MATTPTAPLDSLPQAELPPVIPGYLQQLQQPQQDPNPAPNLDSNFYRNLADEIPAPELDYAGTQIVVWQSDYESGRSQWLRGWSDAAEYLGFTYGQRDTPWPNASGVYDPVMLECMMRGQAELVDAVFASGGPAKAEVYGTLTDAKLEAASRVADHMNWWLSEGMEDFRQEKEQQFWGMVFCGTAFSKVVRNPVTKSPQANYVRASMLFVPFGYSTLRKCPRIIEYMPLQWADVQRSIAAGWYSQDFRPEKGRRVYDQAEQAAQRAMGLRAPISDDDDVELLEAHVELEIDPDPHYSNVGFPLPYCVTVDKRTGKVGSIRRNWLEGDKEFKRREAYIEYGFVPTDRFGIYCIGLAHILGNLARASTGLLRGMMDAATLNNLRGGVRSNEVRIAGDDLQLEPGEWKQVDCPIADLKNGFWSPDYAPPDAVLQELWDALDVRGRRLAGNADLQVSDIGGQTPVGTVLAVIERGMKVFNSIQGRVAHSLKQELGLIRDIIYEDLQTGGEWIRVANKEFPITAQDYENAQVVPSVDPDSGTVSQRILQTQAATTMAQQMPAPFDIKQLTRRSLMALGMTDVDQLVPPDPIIPRLDAVSENARLIVGEPVQAFKDQDHTAHIQTHQSAAQSQQLAAQMASDPQLQTKIAAMQAHISEHLAFQQRQAIEKILGFALPDQMTPEQENLLAPQIAIAAQQAASQADQQQQAAQGGQASQPDPIAQQNAIDNQLKAQKIANDKAVDDAKIAQRDNEFKQKQALELQRIQSTHQIAEQNLALKGSNQQPMPVVPGATPNQ